MDNTKEALLQLFAESTGSTGPEGKNLTPITDRIPITLTLEGDTWTCRPGTISLTGRSTPAIANVYLDNASEMPVATFRCSTVGHAVDGGFVFDEVLTINNDVLEQAEANTTAVANSAVA